MIHHPGRRNESNLDLPGYEIDDHRRITAVGHMDCLEAGMQTKFLHRQMAGSSDAAVA